MKKILLFLIVIMATLAACNKNKATFYPVNNNIKADFEFKTGTYWIYRDSISGRVDSFFVRSTTTINDQFDEGALVENDDIHISQYNIFPSPTTTDTGSWEYTYIGDEISLSCSESKIYTGEILYNPLILYPFNDTIGAVGGDFSSYGDTGTIINNYNQYTINGKPFNNVEEVNHKAYLAWNGRLPAPYSYNDRFYICPNMGLIKIIQNHPQDSVYRVWELQRWKIVN